MFTRERPEAEAVRVRLTRMQSRVAGGVQILYSYWRLYQVNKNSPIGLHYTVADLTVPCRSNLYKFLTGLLLEWKWDFKGDINVTAEQAKYLEIIFHNQKDYTFWKQGLELLGKESKPDTEKAWKWIHEQIPLLKLRNKLEGRE